MKKLLIIALIAISTIAKAQNRFLNDIKKLTNGSSVIYTTPTPAGEDAIVFNLNRVIKTAGDHIILNVGSNESDPNYTTSDLLVRFEDDDILKYFKVMFEKGKKNTSGLYMYSAVIVLDGDDLTKFKTKRVTGFTMFNHTINFNLDNQAQIMTYANGLEYVGLTATEIAGKLVDKQFDEMKNKTTYRSATNQDIQILKTIDSSGSSTMALFYAYKNTQDDQPQSVYIKFDDGEILNFPAMSNCTKVGRGSYLYTCGVILNSINIKIFKEKTIIKFQIADTDIMVNTSLGLNINMLSNAVESLN